ncbi:universal stress protein F [Escherichia coli LAU-EC10]|nr:universal stress family protein [Escherichia coli MS 69-1]ETE14785.1 universal stress protein F [Escherichia coli LAU-EC10]OSK29321.1 universal stress protein F [Escherichia coli M056]
MNFVITQKVSSGVTLYADTKTGGFMNRTILVPIDISDSELTQRVISHVEAEAKIDDAEVHFLTVIPSLPYYASLGLAYSAELPAMDDLKAEAKSQLEEIIKKFKLPTDRVHVHVEEGSPKDRILELAKKIPAHMIIIASHRPDITTYLLGSNAAAVVRHAECSVLVVR